MAEQEAVLAGSICNGSRVVCGRERPCRHGSEILSLERSFAREGEGGKPWIGCGGCVRFPDLDSTNMGGLEGLQKFSVFGAAPAASRVGAAGRWGRRLEIFCPLCARVSRICAKFGRARLHVTH